MTQTTLGQWSQRLLTLAGLFCLFYLFLVLIQPYRFPIVLAEKHGRVIDAQTGKGLPNVAVIVTYNLWSSTPMQAGDGGCMHQKIVWTDADGSYVIPQRLEGHRRRRRHAAADGAGVQQELRVAAGVLQGGLRSEGRSGANDRHH